jgi:hypothetical protein
MGSFLLYPQFTLGTSYNDNIFAEDDNPESDVIFTATPQISLQSDWGRHALSATASATAYRYLDNHTENAEDYALTTNGRLDVTGDTSLFGGAGVQFLHEERGSPEDVGGEEPTEFSILGGQLGLNQGFNRLTLTALGRARHLDYDDVPAAGFIINNDDRDRMEYDARLRASYDFRPGYVLFVEALADMRDYDDKFDDSGFERSSVGYGANAGFSMALTDLIFAELFGGYRIQDYDDPRFDNANLPSLGVDFTWNLTPLTTDTAGASRAIEETTVADAAGFTRTQASLGVDHELLRTVILSASVTGGRNDYDGISREDDLLTVGTGVTYLMNRYFHVNADYAFTRRDSTERDRDYTRNVFRVQGRLQF